MGVPTVALAWELPNTVYAALKRKKKRKKQKSNMMQLSY